jgi:hypothetical protein
MIILHVDVKVLLSLVESATFETSDFICSCFARLLALSLRF